MNATCIEIALQQRGQKKKQMKGDIKTHGEGTNDWTDGLTSVDLKSAAEPE